MTPFPQPTPNPRPRRVLIIAAHPDDAEFMAGGTLARWHAQGASIHYLVVTDGTAGSRDPQMTPARLAAIRREEQINAARIIGCEDVCFLGYTDGRVEPTIQLRFDIARVIRQVRPDVVIAQDPQFRYGPTYINHPDHRAVADAALAAIMPIANTRLAALELIDEGLEPHDVSEVYLSGPVNPTVWIPLSAADLERKIAALREHKSQMGDWDPEAMVREWAAFAAQRARGRHRL
ncbi:PIG-L deacetylase family protein [Kallotenue papyrolyticum]|uniref:PIG-L deacetylase family protein n=1 Tax=Kallotenue papyrolyticum TaxID=1325125 RepID=UPI000492BEC3|nr:PIG-L family deacetylase [Kallotenue papyrolyticum]